jgi:hypothetical protein
MNFKLFKQAIQKQLETMQQGQLFTTNVDGDVLWSTYLDAFPEGTNNIYRVRREHDCSADRSFIRNIGGVVAEVGGEIVSVWDIQGLEEGYQVVANKLAALVKSKDLDTVYRNYQNTVGIDKAYEKLETGEVKTWENFFAKLNSKHFCPKAQVDTIKGGVKTHKQVLERSLNEITDDAVETVLELIAQNSLYRGAEFKNTVTLVRDLKKELATTKNKQIFLFNKAVQLGHVCSLRNTVIGTLLTDISEGVDLDVAVKKFEDKTAPTNYKRPTALVTPKMIDAAEKKVVELGIEPALYRRYAVLEDITINNVLWADRSTKQAMGLFGELKKEAKAKPQNFDKVESVTMDVFINSVLPTAESVELYVENKHTGNFMSLVAPVNADAPNIMKWGNNFSWSYNGEIADSDIRSAVQSRGGSVNGVFRFSHQWNYGKRNTSLMDLHVFLPANNAGIANSISDSYGNSERVGWNNRKHPSSGGVQDVDYVERAPEGFVPVENITFPTLNKMPEGRYVCKIHNWDLRSPTEGGFKAEIEVEGVVYQYEYDRPLKHKEWIVVADVELKDGKFKVNSHLPLAKAVSKQVWNVSTCNFHKVDAIMFSPNHWDGEETGNKHIFFMLDGCVNPEQTRGFYNEFLKQELNEHRKVFEMLGGKLKTPKSDKQLSGLGFSTTKKDEVVVKVTGAFSRIIKIVM